LATNGPFLLENALVANNFRYKKCFEEMTLYKSIFETIFADPILGKRAKFLVRGSPDKKLTDILDRRLDGQNFGDFDWANGVPINALMEALLGEEKFREIDLNEMSHEEYAKHFWQIYADYNNNNSETDKNSTHKE